ncbi:MAG: carbohydrate-binding protein, partial [Verrucomicrobiota bacterium]
LRIPLLLRLSSLLLRPRHDGFLELNVLDENAWLDYQVFTERAETFTAHLRLATAQGAKIELLAGDKALAAFTAPAKGWQTLTAPVALPAGKSAFRLRSNSAARLNWIEFSEK